MPIINSKATKATDDALEYFDAYTSNYLWVNAVKKVRDCLQAEREEVTGRHVKTEGAKTLLADEPAKEGEFFKGEWFEDAGRAFRRRQGLMEIGSDFYNLKDLDLISWCLGYWSSVDEIKRAERVEFIVNKFREKQELKRKHIRLIIKAMEYSAVDTRKHNAQKPKALSEIWRIIDQLENYLYR